MALLLANVEFYTAADVAGRDHAMQLYDHVISIDQHEPMGRYMRGRARNALGNGKGAVDYSAAIALPHILPIVSITGSLGINEGIAALSRQLNLQAKGELYCGGPLHAHCSESGARSSTKILPGFGRGGTPEYSITNWRLSRSKISGNSWRPWQATKQPRSGWQQEAATPVSTS